MLINLTNHSSVDWLPIQLQAAKEFGGVIDMSFPNISPNASEEDIAILSEDYFQKILKIKDEDEVVVHIMGEMNFTYALVKRLRNQGICCVASTTCRIVEERDGQKISTFRFVKFRRYE